MKKIILCLLVMALLASQIPVVFAAGSASVSGPGTVRAGDTIEISFTAGGGILGGQGTVSFDESQLTLKKYSPSLSGNWAVEFVGNKFVFYDNLMTDPITGSKTIFKASFTVNKDLEPGTEIAVVVNDIKLSDENNQQTNIGTKKYSATIAPPLSSNCNLASMTVSNATISPAFSTGTTNYTASVPFTTETLNVSATAEDSDATVTVKNTKLTAGATTTVSVTVKAANGTTKTYSIKVTRAQDPNYVPGNNADLKELTVENFQISPAFSADVQQYYVWLPYEVEGINLSAAAADSKATVSIGDATALVAGTGNDILVTVTAEDGTERIYTVTAVRAPIHNETEAFLNGTPAQEPTTEPTEPSEPATEPTVAPTEAETTPNAPAATDRQSSQTQLIGLISAGALCLIMGILLGIIIKMLMDKKKY